MPRFSINLAYRPIAGSIRRNAANPDARQAAEASLKQLKSNLEMWTDQEQKCQVEQVESENQGATDSRKMTELSDHLDRFDKLLAGAPRQIILKQPLPAPSSSLK
jgi:hypothetical protein